MFLQKPLEMQNGETSLKYVLQNCGLIPLLTICETTGLPILLLKNSLNLQKYVK